MQFVGMYQVEPDLCDSLIDLHRACERRDLVVRGRFGTVDGLVVDTKKKDSYDLGLVTVPDDLLEQYRVPEYYQRLKECVDQYYAQHAILKQSGPIHLAESPII